MVDTHIAAVGHSDTPVAATRLHAGGHDYDRDTTQRCALKEDSSE